MAVATTGSTVQGLTQGMVHNLTGNVGGELGIGEIIVVTGNPDGIVTSPIVSGIAFDTVNGELYKANTTGGSDWTALA